MQHVVVLRWSPARLVDSRTAYGLMRPPLVQVLWPCGSLRWVGYFEMLDGEGCWECETFEDGLCEVG